MKGCVVEIEKLAAIVRGTVEGDGSVDITGVSGAVDAEAGDITFAIDESHLADAEKSGASCILTNTVMRKSPKPLIRVPNPKLAFIVLYNVLNKVKARKPYTDSTASIADSARIGKDVWIGPHVSIEDGVSIADGVIIEGNVVIKKKCRIDQGCRIYPNVTLYEKTVLGKNVVLHSGVVIGSDGFGYMKEDQTIYKFPQLGRVIIGDDVEIGANTTIDRGSLSDTVIGSGTKIDNLCQIAHNVKIGKNVMMAAQCGISGSTTIEDNVLMGGQSGVAENLTIHENARVAAKSGVIGNIEKGATVWGFPARPIGQTKRQIAAVSWLVKNFHAISKLIK